MVTALRRTTPSLEDADDRRLPPLSSVAGRPTPAFFRPTGYYYYPLDPARPDMAPWCVEGRRALCQPRTSEI